MERTIFSEVYVHRRVRSTRFLKCRESLLMMRLSLNHLRRSLSLAPSFILTLEDKFAFENGNTNELFWNRAGTGGKCTTCLTSCVEETFDCFVFLLLFIYWRIECLGRRDATYWAATRRKACAMILISLKVSFVFSFLFLLSRHQGHNFNFDYKLFLLQVAQWIAVL